MCREVFKKFKACLNLPEVYRHRDAYEAINIVYKSLQQDRDQADISDIMLQLHQVAESAINTLPNSSTEPGSGPYDISRIDFDRLRREFQRCPTKNTTVQNLKQAIDQRLQRLLAQNPLRTDFQRHYEEIVADYNREKDRVTIEHTFEALLKFVEELDEEASRALREGLDEETLALFDLLQKPDLGAPAFKKLKKVVVELLTTLKAEKLKIDHWRDKEATRDAVRITIRDFLWNDATGLPIDSYTDDEVNSKSEAIFQHVYWAYPSVPSPLYASVV
jgi:type I restriction enzyme R subunit